MSQATNATSKKNLQKPKLTIRRKGKGISEHNGFDRDVKHKDFSSQVLWYVIDWEGMLYTSVECLKSWNDPKWSEQEGQISENGKIMYITIRKNWTLK